MICPNCGRDVEYGSEFCTYCGAGMGMQAGNSNWQNAAGSGNPSTIPMASPSQNANGQNPGEATPRKNMNRGFLAGIIVAAGVAVAAIVIAVVVLVVPGEPTPANNTTSNTGGSSVSVVPRADSSKDDSGDDGYITGATPVARDTGSMRVTTPEGSLSEDDVYDLLSQYYDLAGSYDRRVATCANDFNSNCYKESRQVRNSKSSTSHSLEREIKDSWDDISSLDIPFWSKNRESWADLVECYECLWHRIDVINEAWDISLKYDKPDEHKDEILAPIKREQVNGDNKYYTRFNQLYPSITIYR